MSSHRDDGGPAFPRAGYEDCIYGSMFDGDRVVEHENGMTLRDYFAAKAIQGLLAGDIPADYHLIDTSPDLSQCDSLRPVASIAYAIADAMLRERAR